MALNEMKEYCLEWDLTVNPTKTKVVIFGRGIMRNLPCTRVSLLKLLLNLFTLVLNLVLTVASKNSKYMPLSRPIKYVWLIQ